ncbi:O-antigen ligase [Roseomonas sp. HF4]|uniref:O-antigen ligase family protein n=1 Tax=Roseomonas sp. HF4 TaxID=2562313 RepID=UPI0010C09E1C|nr:O-antigen ligase [Roseomonas sp. HF4]
MRQHCLDTGRDGPAADLAWLATVLSVIGLIVTLGGSSLGALLFLLAWGLVVAPHASLCMRLVFRSAGIWVVPAVALLSVVWSQAPQVTLRAAVQLLLTVGIASLAAGFLRPRAFVSAMSVSLLFGALLSLAFGRYGVDGMTGATVFLGIFAGKNTMALFMSLLAIFSAAVLMDRGQGRPFRLLAVVSFLLSIPLLLMARSAGALLTTIASLGVLVLTAIFARLRSRERLLLGASLGVLAAPAVVVVLVLAMNGTLGEAMTGFVTEVLGKDATLTGRTVLWRTAWAEIDKRPLLGTGYYAFWLQGDPLVESIWRDFGIGSRMGFHFHNTVLEFAVEVGWLGVAALLLTIAFAVQRMLRLAMADRTPATAALVAALFCLVARTFGEVDAPYPFAIGTFLLFVIAAYGADYARVARSGATRSREPLLSWRAPVQRQPRACL